MGELGLKMMGKNQEGNAEPIDITKHSSVNIANKTKVLINTRFQCVQKGFHIWGETVGRSHRKIYDISDMNSLSVEVIPHSEVVPDRMNLLLFTDNNRVTSGSNASTDVDCMKVVPINRVKTQGKYVLSSEKIGDVTHFIGMAIMVDMSETCDITVKVLGSSSKGLIKDDKFILLYDKEYTFTQKNQIHRLTIDLDKMAKNLKVLIYKKGLFEIETLFLEGYSGVGVYGNSYWNGTSWVTNYAVQSILPAQGATSETLYDLNSAIPKLNEPIEYGEIRLKSLAEPNEDNILKIRVWGEF